MARQTLTPKTALGSYPTLPLVANSLDFTFVAADPVNKEQFVASGNDLVVAWNTDGANPHTVTVNSVADEKGRTGDIPNYSIGAGKQALIGPLQKAGWMQPDGKIYLEASNAAIKFAVVVLP